MHFGTITSGTYDRTCIYGSKCPFCGEYIKREKNYEENNDNAFMCSNNYYSYLYDFDNKLAKIRK